MEARSPRTCRSTSDLGGLQLGRLRVRRGPSATVVSRRGSAGRSMREGRTHSARRRCDAGSSTELARPPPRPASTEPATIAGWQERLELFGVRRRGSLETCRAERVWSSTSTQLLRRRRTARRGSAGDAGLGATLISGEYRAAKKTLREAICARAHKLSAQGDATTAREQGARADRQRLGLASARPLRPPACPAHLAELTTAYEALLRANWRALRRSTWVRSSRCGRRRRRAPARRAPRRRANARQAARAPPSADGALTQAGMRDLLADLRSASPSSREEAGADASSALGCARCFEHIQLTRDGRSVPSTANSIARRSSKSSRTADREHIETTPQRVRRLLRRAARSAPKTRNPNKARAD